MVVHLRFEKEIDVLDLENWNSQLLTFQIYFGVLYLLLMLCCVDRDLEGTRGTTASRSGHDPLRTTAKPTRLCPTTLPISSAAVTRRLGAEVISEQ